jgi:peptide/nickel transport system ATP-binding protein
MKTALELRDITVKFPGLLALDRVSLTIQAHTTLGLVGESGSGKSTLARTAAGLLTPDGGSVALNGVILEQRRTREQRRTLQMVFQNPGTSLNPRLTVRRMLTEALLFHRMAEPPQAEARCRELLEQVQLERSALDRFPGEFSGGQRQRIAIARALSVKPLVLIADEPTSSLDVSVQRSILELLRGLQRELNLTMLFISHDMGVINAVSDAVAVIRRGKLIESAPRDQFFRMPQEPYSRELLAAVPRMPSLSEFPIEIQSR